MNRLPHLVFVAALGLAACGADAAPEPSLQVQLDADDNVFEPDRATAVAGPVTFTVKNVGAVPHRFNLLEPGVTITGANQFDPATSLGEVVVGRNQTLSVTIDLDPDVYQYVCLIPGHLEAGMAGLLTVG